MAAIGQGGGAGAPAGPGTGAQAPGAAAAGTPGGGTPNTDPFGFAAAAATAPEHLRPMLQSEFDRLTPALQAQIAPYEPLQPYMERLAPLTQTNGDQPAVLEGLLNLYEMATDETRIEDLADWWSSVGTEFGFFDDEEGGSEPGQGAPGQQEPGAQQQLDANNPLTPVVTQLQEQLQQLQQRLDGREQSEQQQTAVNAARERINRELEQGMRQAGFLNQGDQFSVEAQDAQDILGMALRYGSDPHAVPRAIADFARVSGRGERQLLNGTGEDTAAVEALRAAMQAGGQGQAPGQGNGMGLPGPGPSLGRGEPSTDREHHTFESARGAALSRLTGAAGTG